MISTIKKKVHGTCADLAKYLGSNKWAIIQNRSIKQSNYHIGRISVFPELSDFHISRTMEILETCKSENSADT